MASMKANIPWQLMKTAIHSHDEWRCPTCHAFANGQACEELKTEGPRAGDYVMCGYCGSLALVEDEKLRPLTEAERLEFRRDYLGSRW